MLNNQTESTRRNVTKALGGLGGWGRFGNLMGIDDYLCQLDRFEFNLATSRIGTNPNRSNANLVEIIYNGNSTFEMTFVRRGRKELHGKVIADFTAVTERDVVAVFESITKIALSYRRREANMVARIEGLAIVA